MVEGAHTAEVGNLDQIVEQFPFTKFLPPTLDDRVVADSVVERVVAGVASCRLTVVAAPAGAGKTTALAAWVPTSDSPVIWVRMNDSEDSPSAAAAALLAGARTVIEGFGSRLGQVLGTPDAATSPHHLITSLVNDLGDQASLVFVLDDFHEITDPRCLAFFDSLIDNLPPRVRVLIGSRTEPDLSLARRRARGEVAVVGVDDLRLDRDAIRAVLEHESAVSGEVVDAVATASDGWAAAVRLAAAQLSVGHLIDPGAGLPRLHTDLSRFLLEEVLDDQPADLRRFLLETSILEELSPRLCDAVTEQSGSASMLAELDRRNLLVARYAARGGDAWRNHDLFAEFLRNRLRAEYPPEEVTALHRRAADMLPPAAAVQHLLAVGDHERVATLAIETGFGGMDARDLLLAASWVDALPAEVVARDHRLALLLATRDEGRGRFADIRARMEPLHARLIDDGQEHAAAEVAAELATALMMLGDLDRADEILDHAATRTLEPLQILWLLLTRVYVSRARGDWAGASTALEEALAIGLQVDHPAIRETLAFSMSFTLLFADPGPDYISNRVGQLVTRMAGSDTFALTPLRRFFAGVALLELDVGRAIDEARRCLTESAELGGLTWVTPEAECLLLLGSLATGDHMTVQRVVDDALERVPESRIDAGLLHAHAYATIKSSWLRGRDDQIRATVARVLPPERAIGSPEEQIVHAVADALMARAEGDVPDRVIDVLRKAEELQNEARCWLGAGLPGLELASIMFEQGRDLAAIQAAESTLAVAADLGAGILLPEAAAHRDLLEHCAKADVYPEVVRSTLAVIDRARPLGSATVPDTGERLSPREVEVLTEVALGRSNRDIAESLFISEVTVKSHLTRILRKLDATSRTHAVARARDLRLL